MKTTKKLSFFCVNYLFIEEHFLLANIFLL